MLDELRRQVRRVVCDRACTPAQRDRLLGVLGRPGFALHPTSGCRVGVFALHVHQALSGTLGEAAFRCAAAVELEIEASFVLDDLADHGPRVPRAAYAEELALAVALLECGNCAACESAVRLGQTRALDALLGFHESCLAACQGQLLDASLEQRDDITIDEALEATCLKSGSLGRFVGGFAARIATADPVVVSVAENLGHNAFTFIQLVDDLEDAYLPDGLQDDLTQRKKTVPTVVFRNYVMSARPAGDVCKMYDASGAGLYGAILAEVYLGRAKRDLSQLAGLHYRVDDLACFIDSLSACHVAALGPGPLVSRELPRARDVGAPIDARSRASGHAP